MARTRDLWKNPERRGRGKRYLAIWTGPDGREKSRAFARKGEADRYGAAMETDALRGIGIDPRRGAMIVREYAETKWLPAQHHHARNTGTVYRSHLANQVYPLIGDRRIG